MDLENAMRAEKALFPDLFNRLPVVLERGQDVHVWDADGKKYLDMFAGVAVSSIGHAHPRMVKTISAQAAKMIHASNWVFTESQLTLAKKLADLSGMEKVFFTNDGAGAVETAIKLARKATGRTGIVSMEGAFHGRTMGALSATWSKKYREPFEPLIPGFSFARYDDISSVEAAVGEDTAAIIVEPILGEAGAIVPHGSFLKDVEKIAHDAGALLIVDEIQTGFGRCGQMFAYKGQGISPDIVTCAKGLGGGFPLGAVLFSGCDFDPGQHGGTYNGGPLACEVALTVLSVIEDEGLVANSKKMGDYIKEGLSSHSVHGAGLMLGVDTDDGRGNALKLMKRGIIPIYSGNILRLLPPLTLKKEHADIVIGNISEVL